MLSSKEEEINHKSQQLNDKIKEIAVLTEGINPKEESKHSFE